jgi:hypothetical protein
MSLFRRDRDDEQRYEPPAPQPPPKRRDPRELHPAAQEAAIVYSEALKANEELSARCRSLEHGLHLANSKIVDLNAVIERERGLLEVYRRYSISVQAALKTVVSTIMEADRQAASLAEHPVPETETEKLDRLEADIRAAASENAASPPTAPER